MAALTPRVPDLNGLTVTAYSSAAGGGDTFAAEDSAKYLLHIKNGHTATQTVTIDDPNTQTPADATAFNPDVAIPVVNAGEVFAYIQEPRRFKDSVTGNISLSYSGTTLLTLAVYKL